MRRKRSTDTGSRRVKFLLIIVGIIAAGWFLLEFGKYIPALWQLLFQREIALKQSEDQRVNILLLGIGGGSHDGPLLTDTIIMASIDPKTKKVSLISVPRDFWVPELRAKINTAYAKGEAKRQGGGLLLAKAVVSKILGQDIDYGVRIDFNGFVKAVDMVGGLELTVDRSFDDEEYPISGKEQDDCGFKDEEFEKRATASSQLEAFPCRYENLRFDKGPQQMDGQRALKFVRSRHGNNGEGSDFARSKRQEKVISAFRDKVFSLQTFLNPVRLIGLYETFKGMVDTDIQPTETDDFLRLANKLKDAKIKSVVIDAGDSSKKREGLLDNPLPSSEFGYQWIISPRAGVGNYGEIQEYVDCELKTSGCVITPTINPDSTETN